MVRDRRAICGITEFRLLQFTNSGLKYLRVILPRNVSASKLLELFARILAISFNLYLLVQSKIKIS